MSFHVPKTFLQLRSLIKASGALELSLVRLEVPRPGPDEVVVRIEASPLNPSDIGLLFGAADMDTAVCNGSDERSTVVARVPEAGMKAMAARLDASLPIGNEGAGIVVDAGASSGARALLGRTVSIFGGAMYSQYRCVRADQCMVLPEDHSPRDGASSFVNPLTALGMIETMRREGHVALVHTAAASNLGQMLNRVCIADNIALVNVVRRQSQADLLKRQGARFVCDTSSPTFMDDLTEALAQTGATIAFDATGGGGLASQILTCMERALSRKAQDAYSRYGSTTLKQVYIYGGLDTGATEIRRNFGMAWSVGGWLMSTFLSRIGAAATTELKTRIASQLKTTFRSHYSGEISLAEMLRAEVIAEYSKRATGEKYLVNPNKGN
ncbi:zinc-binding dehydrogenase [Pandoraea pulmonicola]|uniref:NADH oxidase n=1 Tax=Pandoraea pulmonicola TaxID=93221 RepID=A0AAJ5D2F5_PANPU|nr:zinc-binding dehydrogenase [Pandoraea pulmonicola]AJC22893.1 NADH oxidase [Pandoraea pulmonicola]SUA92783.1 quinone oxidoreductase, NADPH-dependent [Pandoraea pulmonicola]